MCRCRWLALVAACFIAVPVNAAIQAWEHVTASDDSLTNFYVDARSVAAHGSTRLVRLLFDYAQLQQNANTLVEHRSSVELVLIDCRHRAIAPIEAIHYGGNMGHGGVVARETSPQPLRQVLATPASIDERVVDFVCESRAGHSRRAQKPASGT
jgi:hypothetical protein